MPSSPHRRLFRAAALICALFRLTPALNAAPASSAGAGAHTWGNAVYVNLNIGESHRFLDRVITLRAIEGPTAVIDVNGTRETLSIARRRLPRVIAGVRVFLADCRPAARLTKNEKHIDVRHALTKDVMLCLSDPRQPLLDPKRFTFPISRADGYKWTMEEDSHMFAYLDPTRAHEGMDLNLHDARGIEKHPIVAIEAGTVRWIETTQAGANEACLLLESAAQPGVFYIYQHLNRDKLFVSAGQKVERGQELGYIWGDWRWGHLHFAVVGQPPEFPTYTGRYRGTLNAFPQMFELWHGNLDRAPRKWEFADFEFAKLYWTNGNRQCISVYDDVVGYGWRLGSWCVAGKVEKSSPRQAVPNQSARLRKRMHDATTLPAENPDDFFDFEVAVENGFFAVKAEVGDRHHPTWQRVLLEGNDAGSFALASGVVQWTETLRVKVADGKLTLRVYLKDPDTAAGVSAFSFQRID